MGRKKSKKNKKSQSPIDNGQDLPKITLKSNTIDLTVIFSSNTSFNPADTDDTVVLGKLVNSSTTWTDHSRSQPAALPPHSYSFRINKGRFRVSESYHNHSMIFVQEDVRNLTVLRSDDYDDHGNLSNDWTVVFALTSTYPRGSFSADEQWVSEKEMKPYVGLNRRARFLAERTHMGQCTFDKRLAEFVITSEGTKSYIEPTTHRVIDRCRYVKVIVGNYRDVEKSRFDLDVLGQFAWSAIPLQATILKHPVAKTEGKKMAKALSSTASNETTTKARTKATTETKVREKIREEDVKHEVFGYSLSIATSIEPIDIVSQVPKVEVQQEIAEVLPSVATDEITKVETEIEMETEEDTYGSDIENRLSKANPITREQYAEVPLSLSRWASLNTANAKPVYVSRPRVPESELPQYRSGNSLLVSKWALL